MENSAYNSLTQKLIQNGILPSENEENASNFFENTSTNPIIEEETEQKNKNKKRINQYDLDII